MKILFHSLALVVSLGAIGYGRLPAQTFKTLHSFTNGSDGGVPTAGLVLVGNTLYGTAQDGNSTNGTVFTVNTDGTGFTNLHKFSVGNTNTSRVYTNSDGASPHATLVFSNNILYGTAYGGGTLGKGTVFALNLAGRFTNLHNFTGVSEGAHPFADLTLCGNTLFGTTKYGGNSGNGTVFAINIDGTGFTNLHNFTPLYGGTNSDGAQPFAGLVAGNNMLYGTTYYGGSGKNGTIYKLNADGTGFTTLHSFAATLSLNNDGGANPYAGLVLSGNTLYGAGYQGGNPGSGTLFSLNTDGTGFTTLHNFPGVNNTEPSGYANSDGLSPIARLALSGKRLYGTAFRGGSSGNGTVFAINTNGTRFTTLYSFTATPVSPYTNNDGTFPMSSLVLSGDTIYGTATRGGSSAYGTVFSLSFAPQVTINRSAANAVLKWPTNVAGFNYSGYTLQSTTNLSLPAIWKTNSLTPVVLNGQYAVTNPISGNQTFYRLSQ